MLEVTHAPRDVRQRRWTWSMTARTHNRISAYIFIVVLSVVIILKILNIIIVALLSTKATPPPLQLDQFKSSRYLLDYINNTEVLIEPPSTVCEAQGNVSLLVLVASAPHNEPARCAIRRTWGQHLPTYFMIGQSADENETLEAMNTESSGFNDMVVFDFIDSLSNQTLMTALMLRWARERCPRAGVVFRARDDVLVNPWTMDAVLKAHANADLIGFKSKDTRVTRDVTSEWFLPKWMYPEDTIPEYLKGTGYIIKGNQIETILTVAEKIPLNNLEDVYFTYNVAKAGLGLTLDHDKRLKPHKPWFPWHCSYWELASSRGFLPDEIEKAWSIVSWMGEQSKKNDIDCGVFEAIFSDKKVFAAIRNNI